MVRVDPHDISSLLVLNEDADRWISVPCITNDVSGMSLKRWREVARQARELTPDDATVARSTLEEARLTLAREAEALGLKPLRPSPQERRWLAGNQEDDGMLLDLGTVGDRDRAAARRAPEVDGPQGGRVWSEVPQDEEDELSPATDDWTIEQDLGGSD